MEDEIIKAAISIKKYCKETECEDCSFSKKDGTCKLFEVVPYYWEIAEDEQNNA